MYVPVREHNMCHVDVKRIVEAFVWLGGSGFVRSVNYRTRLTALCDCGVIAGSDNRCWTQVYAWAKRAVVTIISVSVAVFAQ